jgi:hypothetical protein
MKKVSIVICLLALVFSGLYAQQLTTFKADRFDKAVTVDNDFVYYISLMNGLAAQNNLYINVQGSGFRQASAPVRNAIVPPSETSNHLVGHAVDINITYNGNYYNSSALGNFNNLPQAIKNFINGCKANGMRWGNDFRTPGPDPVHFDDNLALRDRRTYDRLYVLYQQ